VSGEESKNNLESKLTTFKRRVEGEIARSSCSQIDNI
jgi:hypothetical protein